MMMNKILTCLRGHINDALEMFDIPPYYVKSMLAFCAGFKRDGKWVPGWIRFGASEKDKSLFHNGIFFFRFCVPFCVCIGIRWAGNDPAAKELFQLKLGWALNGQFSGAFRFQSDNSSAAGDTGPNLGQAQGWNEGTH